SLPRACGSATSTERAPRKNPARSHQKNSWRNCMLRALILLLFVSTEVLAQRVEYKVFPSKLLGRELRYGVYLPPSYSKSPDKKYPVLYFLHGLFEDETRWSGRGDTDQILDRLIGDGKIGEFIVAIPYGGTSFYTNMRDGSEKWEDVIVT